ncbi:hypothetical protein L9F63_016128, partial [Diploptera punctata]
IPELRNILQLHKTAFVGSSNDYIYVVKLKYMKGLFVWITSDSTSPYMFYFGGKNKNMYMLEKIVSMFCLIARERS